MHASSSGFLFFLAVSNGNQSELVFKIKTNLTNFLRKLLRSYFFIINTRFIKEIISQIELENSFVNQIDTKKIIYRLDSKAKFGIN